MNRNRGPETISSRSLSGGRSGIPEGTDHEEREQVEEAEGRNPVTASPAVGLCISRMAVRCPGHDLIFLTITCPGENS